MLLSFITRTNWVNFGAFQSICQRMEFGLSISEIGDIFATYENKSNMNYMDYILLIKDLCTNFNHNRKDCVRTMYERLDYNEDGKIRVSILVELFNAKNHFDVKTGRKTFDEVNKDFRRCVDIFKKIKNSDYARSEQILQLYQCMSPSIESDFSHIIK